MSYYASCLYMMYGPSVACDKCKHLKTDRVCLQTNDIAEGADDDAGGTNEKESKGKRPREVIEASVFRGSQV